MYHNITINLTQSILISSYPKATIMTEEGQTATKKTVTTTATAVPVGSADDGEVTVPRCLVICVVALDAIALLFWIFTFWVPFLGFIGLLCAIAASILACIIPCQTADKEFGRSINTLMYVHIAFGVCYIASIALAAAALSEAVSDGIVTTPMGIAALVFTFFNLVFLLTGLVLASILLCKINAKR